MKFRVNCDDITCKYNFGKLGPFRRQCKKREITIKGGICQDNTKHKLEPKESISKINIVKCPYEPQKHFYCMEQRSIFPNWRKGCKGKVDYTQCSVYRIFKARSKLEEVQ